MAVCRACLSTDAPLIKIDEHFVIGYNLLTNLNISQEDNLSQSSCCSCANIVRLFIQFRERSQASETTLRERVYLNIKLEEELTDVSCDGIDNSSYEIEHKVKSEDEENTNISYSFETNNCLDTSTKTDQLTEDKQKKKKGAAVRGKAKVIAILTRKRVTKVKEIKATKVKKEILNNKLNCGLCSKTFDEKTELDQHLEDHKLRKYCNICLEKFNSFSELFAHRLKHLTHKQKNCHVCSKKFVKCDYIEFHYRAEHFREEGQKLKCSYCFSTYDTPRKLNKHIARSHGKQKYICDHCSKVCQTKHALKYHINTKHAITDKRYVCDMCEYKSKFRSGLINHKIRKHSTIKIYCRNCERHFISQESFDAHKCAKVIIVCPVCGLQFTKKKRFSLHLNSHSDEKKYACKLCPAKFKSRTSLSIHLNRHDGNKTNHCDLCDAKFYVPSSLIKHRRTHTGEKPYVCKICNKGFMANYNLKVHMRVHGENVIKKRTKEPNTCDGLMMPDKVI